VSVEEMGPGKDGKTLYIRAVIYVEKESHKGILVGANGKMLKKIGTLAREEIAYQFQRPVYLDLWVKVKEGWQDREEMLHLFGYA
jgi:GTP-binding protein Era